MRETSSRVLALMQGDIPSADTNLPPEQLEKLGKNPRLKVTSHESMSPFYIEKILQHPLKVAGFKPFPRDEIYERS